MVADITHVGSTEDGVADGVDEYVGIAVAEKPQGVFKFDAANPEFAAWCELMDVVAHPNT